MERRPHEQAIVDFVHATTETGGAKFVPSEERIAAFDPGRNALGRASYLFAVYILPGLRAGASQREAGTKER
jgi:hypothetical protein